MRLPNPHWLGPLCWWGWRRMRPSIRRLFCFAFILKGVLSSILIQRPRKSAWHEGFLLFKTHPPSPLLLGASLLTTLRPSSGLLFAFPNIPK